MASKPRVGARVTGRYKDSSWVGVSALQLQFSSRLTLLLFHCCNTHTNPLQTTRWCGNLRHLGAPTGVWVGEFLGAVASTLVSLRHACSARDAAFSATQRAHCAAEHSSCIHYLIHLQALSLIQSFVICVGLVPITECGISLVRQARASFCQPPR